MKKSKLIVCALGLFFPGSGLNCFYLQGWKSFWAWVQLFALIGGFAGWSILKSAHFHSAPGWVLITFGFIAIEASWLTTIAFGLRPDEKWDTQFNPGIEEHRRSRSGCPCSSRHLRQRTHCRRQREPCPCGVGCQPADAPGAEGSRIRPCAVRGHHGGLRGGVGGDTAHWAPGGR